MQRALDGKLVLVSRDDRQRDGRNLARLQQMQQGGGKMGKRVWEVQSLIEGSKASKKQEEIGPEPLLRVDGEHEAETLAHQPTLSMLHSNAGCKQHFAKLT